MPEQPCHRCQCLYSVL